jgi:hypothetical protein
VLAIESEALALLEWPRLAAHLASFASTAVGGRLCRSLPLPASLTESRRRLAETTELLALDGLVEGGLSFQGVADLGDLLQHCGKGGTASGVALLELAATLAAGRQKIALLDTDPQASLSRWAALREGREGVAAISFEAPSGWRVTGAIDRLKRSHDVVIMDTAPHADTDSKVAIRAADLVIIPMQPAGPESPLQYQQLSTRQQTQIHHPVARPLKPHPRTLSPPRHLPRTAR